MPETKINPTEPETNLNDVIERILGIVKRRRWWILSAACCIPTAVVAVALKLPDHYVSQATLLVVQQQVSHRYVEPDSTATIAATIQAMKLEVLSAGQLAGIIKDLGLYGTGKEVPTPELVDRMRQDIDIQPLQTAPGPNDFNALAIAFTAPTPQLAHEVTRRLTSLFIEQHLKTREEQAATTTRFLNEQLAAAKQRLEAQEQRLQAFKRSNLEVLPEQQSTNLAALMDLRNRLNVVTTAAAQAKQQQTSLGVSLSERRANYEYSLNERLSRLQSERAALMVNFTAQHPQVVDKDREIARVQAMLDHLKAGLAAPGKTPDADSPDEAALAGIMTQIEANAAEMERLFKQEQKLNAEIAQYQTRLNLTPLSEQQLAAILQDYELFKKDYTDLQNKKLQSEVAANMEEQEQGQQFRLVGAPTLPVKPSGPKRLPISLGGMAGGILVGLLLAFLIESRDDSLHSEKELSKQFSLPLMMGVPLVRTYGERRARGRRIAFEGLAGCVLILAMFAAEYYVYLKG